MVKLLNKENVKTIAYLGTGGSFTEIAKDYFCKSMIFQHTKCRLELLKRL